MDGTHSIHGRDEKYTQKISLKNLKAGRPRNRD
jgi:hypothetical protein